MADSVTARDQAGPERERALPEAGQGQGVLVDVIDLGMKADSYQGGEEHLVPKVALVFQTAETNAETGKRYHVHKEYTVSMGKKSNLRKDLETWRGREYSDDEAKRGVDLASLVGANALLNMVHKVSNQSGKPFVKIIAIGGLPRGMEKIKPQDYERAEFWTDRKREYATKAAPLLDRELRARKARAEAEEALDLAPTGDGPDDEDDLPF
jgi:hypothetical protein